MDTTRKHSIENISSTDALFDYESSIKEYVDFRNTDDQAIRIGLFGDNICKAFDSEGTIFIDSTGGLRLPVFVPVQAVDWFNQEIIESKYGDTDKAYVYAHPPIKDDQSLASAESLANELLNSGAVIITEKYDSDDGSFIANYVNKSISKGYKVDTFGDNIPSRVDVFSGIVRASEFGNVKRSSNFYDTYVNAVSNNEISVDIRNGVTIQECITGDEADDIWKVYEHPFDDLGKNDLTYAGFDKESMMDILSDPEVTKIVKRVNGEIASLCIFLHDFEKAPWFNDGYYKQNYFEFYDTGNILMFPGIVSDESKRGNNYATDLIQLAAQVASKRDTDLLITFECTEVSSQYIPLLVSAAINNSGLVTIDEINEPISEISYFAITKT